MIDVSVERALWRTLRKIYRYIFKSPGTYVVLVPCTCQSHVQILRRLSVRRKATARRNIDTPTSRLSGSDPRIHAKTLKTSRLHLFKRVVSCTHSRQNVFAGLMPPLRTAAARVSRACDICRKGKTRCYTDSPSARSCLRCQTLRLRCSLDNAARPTPPKTRERSSESDTSTTVLEARYFDASALHW